MIRPAAVIAIGFSSLSVAAFIDAHDALRVLNIFSGSLCLHAGITNLQRERR